MSTYVDALVDRGLKLRGHAVKSCHLIGDTLDELHAVASAVGCKRAWFQPTSFPHYDLTESRRAAAIRAGAQELPRAEFVAQLRRIRSAGGPS